MEKPNYLAFTTKWDGQANALITDAFIEYNNQTLPIKALWDTGATGTCVSPNVVAQLGMIATGKGTSHTAAGIATVNTYLANIILPNHVRVTDVAMIDASIGTNGFDVLIGMDIIGMGDFCISNMRGKTTLSFRIPSKEVTDYVVQINLENKGIKPGRRSKG